MPPTTSRSDPVMAGSVTDFEPDEHDALMMEYAQIGERYKALWAKYGAGNVTERKFKSLVSAIQVEIRTTKAAANEKVTDGATEALAYADPRTKTMLHEIEMGRLEFEQADIDIDIVKERIRRLDAVTRRGL